MAQQVASYVVRPSILRAASLAGYEHRRRVFCLKQGRAAARISPGRCSQHRFDSMAWSRVQLPGKKMGEREPDLYRFLGWIFDHSRGIFGEKKKEKLFVIFYVAILLINIIIIIRIVDRARYTIDSYLSFDISFRRWFVNISSID